MAARRRTPANGTDAIAAAEPHITHEAQEVTTRRDSAPPPSSNPGQTLKYSSIFIVPYLYLLCCHYDIDARLKLSIFINAVFSAAGFGATLYLIPLASRKLLRRDISGYDINKKGTPQGSIKVEGKYEDPVSPLLLPGDISFNKDVKARAQNTTGLGEYNAALLPICFMILLGFADDVLDVPWRVKLLLPSIAVLPLLTTYAGPTSVIPPKPLRPYIGDDLELGCIYKLYMWLLAIFCTNSINIHAGINGLEVGQTVVIAGAILIHNVMQIGEASEHKEAHAFSIYFVQPLLSTSLALLSFNCETLLIFFLPQVLNFLLSLPQLSGYIPCPRHRLPRFDPETGLLTGTNDGTLVNLFLRKFGKMSEQSLCVVLLAFQVICCGFCFFLRWLLAGWWK